MWPRSAQDLYPGLEPPSSHSSDQNFDFFYVRMLERITACLEFRLSHHFETDERLFPAVLVFNPSEDPLWCDLRRGYGTGQTKHWPAAGFVDGNLSFHSLLFECDRA